MSRAAVQFTVSHQPDRKRFVAQFVDGATGLLEYEKVGEKSYDMYHTEVPSSKQGQGVAGALAKVISVDVDQNNSSSSDLVFSGSARMDSRLWISSSIIVLISEGHFST
jgi:predicted GNAT family acetyltransferase